MVEPFRDRGRPHVPANNLDLRARVTDREHLVVQAVERLPQRLDIVLVRKACNRQWQLEFPHLTGVADVRHQVEYHGV